MNITRSEVAAAVQRLAETPDGQALFAYFTSKYGFTRKTTLVPGNADLTASNEGQRMVLVDLGILMDVDPLKLAEMEQAERGFDHNE